MSKKNLLIFLKYFLINGYVGTMVIWLNVALVEFTFFLWFALHLILIVAVSIACVFQELRNWQLWKD